MMDSKMREISEYVKINYKKLWKDIKESAFEEQSKVDPFLKDETTVTFFQDDNFKKYELSPQVDEEFLFLNGTMDISLRRLAVGLERERERDYFDPILDEYLESLGEKGWFYVLGSYDIEKETFRIDADYLSYENDYLQKVYSDLYDKGLL